MNNFTFDDLLATGVVVGVIMLAVVALALVVSYYGVIIWAIIQLVEILTKLAG